MKLSLMKPFVIKAPLITIDRKTIFFVLEESPANAIDFLKMLPIGISSVLEPRYDIKRLLISKETATENKITTNEDIQTYNIVRLNLALMKNKPFAINLNSIFSPVDKSAPLKFSWASRVFIAKSVKAIKELTSLVEKQGYTTVLLYSVNDKLNHPSSILNARIFPILYSYKMGDKLFDYIALNHVTVEGKNNLTVISNSKDLHFNRTRQLLTAVYNKTGKYEAEEETEEWNEVPPKSLTQFIADIIKTEKYKKPLDTVDLETKELAVKALAVMNSQKKSIKEKDGFVADIVKKNIKNSQIESWLNENIGSVLDYTRESDKNKIKNDSSISNINETIVESVTKDVDISQLANRRGVEMNQIFMDDVKKVVKDLENRSGKFKIKVTDIKTVQLNNSADVRETIEDELRITYTNFAGNSNVLKFKIPRLLNNNYFKHYGQKKALIYQIIPDIITKPKPDVVRISSNYAVVKITRKSTDVKFFYEMFIGGKKLSLGIPLMYWFGIDGLFKYIGVDYTTSKEQSKDSILINGVYYTFSPSSNIHIGIINGIKRTLAKIKPEILNGYNDPDQKQFMINLFEDIFGNSMMIFVLDSIFENFIDPLTKDIAIQKNMPTEFQKLLVYAVEFLEVSNVTRPTDLSQHRLRYSEVITLTIAKSLNASFNDYKSRAAVGDTQAQMFIDPNIVIKTLNESTLLALIDSANPIEEIQTLTRVKPMGPGGIPSKNAATLAMRNIDETHYGVIDPIDTPESDSIGISRQLVVSQDLTNSKGYFKQYNKNKREIIFGVGSALTPYANYDDGNRLQMASNQVRQAIPIINPEQPLVQTGYETVIRGMLSDNFVKRSYVDGEVTEIVENHSIIVVGSSGKEYEISISPLKLSSGTGKSSGSIFTPKVKIGDNVRKDQIIAEGAHMKDGVLSMGRTLLTGVCAYNGYTFEDSLMISESLAREQKLTSLHILEFQFFFDQETPIDFVAEIGTVLKDGDPLAIFKKTSIEGIMMDVDEYDENDNDSIDIIDSVNNKILTSPAGEVIDIQIYAQTAINPKYNKYRVGKIGGHIYKGQPMKKNYIVFKLKQLLPIVVGDKLCNRHGNKGIISRVVKDSDMPQWRGKHLDILYSPLSITGRMNMGQLYESALGLCIKEMSIIILNNKSSKQKVMDTIKFFYTTLDVSKNKEMSKNVIINYDRIIFGSRYNSFIKELEDGRDFAIVVPPFKEPKLKQIQIVMNKFGLKDSYKLYFPEFGTESLSEVTIGYQTWYKLEHISENKIHARSVGSVGANLQGVAGKKRGGAAKLGELDISALVSHGVTDFLKESFSLSSDDHTKKTKAINDIIENGFTHLSEEPISSPTKQIMSNYLLGMQLSVEGLNKIDIIKKIKSE